MPQNHEYFIRHARTTPWIEPLLKPLLESTQPWLVDHSIRTGDIALHIGSLHGLPDRDLRIVTLAGLTHDIGKTEVPDAILNKEGPLSDEEWAVMRLHPRYGFEKLRSFAAERDDMDQYRSEMDMVGKLVVAHHEYQKGREYPRMPVAFAYEGNERRSAQQPELSVLQQILAAADYIESRMENGGRRKYVRKCLTLQEACDAAHEELSVPDALIELARTYTYTPEQIHSLVASIQTTIGLQ